MMNTRAMSRLFKYCFNDILSSKYYNHIIVFTDKQDNKVVECVIKE